MKVLMLTPYITLQGHPEFMRNRTGFGYMVYDIARAVARTEEVSLLATDSCGRPFWENGVYILKRSIGMILRYIFHCLPLSSVFKLMRQYHEMQLRTVLRVLYYWLITGYVNSIIQKWHFDVVHIHGCSFATELWLQVCKRYGVKYVVTLHGLNSFCDTVNLEPARKRYEKDFLERVASGVIPITVISTGMNRLIERTFEVKDCKNITVVCNAINISSTSYNLSIKTKYNIPEDSKIILYVGNISANKNQSQMVRGFELLPEDIKDKTWILFCGEDHSGDCDLHSLIAESKYSNHLILCGGVEKSQMSQYYKTADGVALLSIAEGFGLSLVEGMYFGVPCVMFKDLDAFEDIYDECAVIPIENRDDTAVASAIEELLEKSWDSTAIKAYSRKYDCQSMARNYIAVYSKLQQDELL